MSQAPSATADLAEGLHEALDMLADDNAVRVVILTGAGWAFCSGFDLKGTAGHRVEVEQGAPPMRVQQHIAGVGDASGRVRAPVIGAVNGVASGAGWRCRCSATCASPRRRRFNVAMVRLGLSGCDIGLSLLLPKIVGFTRAYELQLSARVVDADEALRIGLVTPCTSRTT